jgi:hypothetical protein
VIARDVVASGDDAERVATEIVERLRAPDLRIVFAFADWRLDAVAVARTLQRGLAPAPVVGGTTVGVIARGAPSAGMAIAALGLYGDWVRIGIGVAPDLPKSPLTRSRDAVHLAAASLGTTPDELDATKHVMITMLDGKCGHEEAFCIGSAAVAPQIRVVGGCVACEVETARKPYLWALGEVMTDAGVAIVLESERLFHALTSAHLVATSVKTVVTAASGRVIDELDGQPAAKRLRALVADLGEPLDEQRPLQYAFARFIDAIPYVRSLTHIADGRVHLASAVEVGHVLRVMKPGDLIGQTRRDLGLAADRVGGAVEAMLAFSCIGRHWEAAARGIESELAEAYAAYPTIGYQSFGEQSGMLLVNHSLTGLAIGAARR